MSSSSCSSCHHLSRENLITRTIKWEWFVKLSKTTTEFMQFLEMCSRQNILNKVDFELLLEMLTNTEAQDKGGKLIWTPVFFNLPAIAQTRLLYILQVNTSQISHHSLFKFIEVIKTSDKKWVQEMIRQLAAKMTCEKPTTYSLHSDLHPVAISIEEKECSNKGDTNPQRRYLKLDAIVDVIVIDDDDVCQNNPNTQPTCALPIKRKLQEEPSDNLGQTTTVFDTTSNTGSKVSKSNLHSPHQDSDVNSQDTPLHRLTYGDVVPILGVFSPAVENKENFVDKVNNLKDKNQTDGDFIEKEPDSILNSAELAASFCPEAKFSQLCNACQSQDIDVTLEMLTPFTDLTLLETKQICVSLDLAHLSEKMIVNIIDYMPWQNLSASAASVILDSLLVIKLCELTSEPSDRFLSSLMLIASSLSQVLVDVFVKVLLATNSGIFQCQLITSICKTSLPLEEIPYFIRHIVKEKIVCNDELTSMLQVLIERNPSLDDDSLKNLLTLLSQHAIQCQTPKFGKLLLSVITKYGTGMSSEHLVFINALTNGHTSSMKKILINAVKKIQQKQGNS